MVLSLAYAWCNVPLMPLRAEPSHKAEQISQLLFGERVEITELKNKDWAHIHNAWDGYEGWCRQSQLCTVTKKEFCRPAKYLTASHTDKLLMPAGEMLLPLGSELPGYRAGKLKSLNGTGKFKGKKLKVSDLEFNCDSLRKAAFHFLHAPYQWGGKSILGIDCSGLTQMAFRLCNKPIPRDASEQSAEGVLVDFLQHGQCGDLAFFENKEGKIYHVGLLLDNQTIIHATDTVGRVVIDRIDPEGIISTTLKMRTHRLRFVKRIG